MEEKQLKNYERAYCKIFLWIFFAFLAIILIAFITFIVIVEMQKNAQRKEMECQVYYLKNQHISEESFDSLGEYFGEHESCVTKIHNKKKFIMTSLKERLNTKTNRGVTICIEKNFRDSDYLNKMLLQEIIQYSKISWKFWSYFSRNERFEILSCNLNDMENNAYYNCTNSISDDSDDSDSSGDFNFVDDEDYERARSAELFDVNSDLFFVNN